MPASAGWKTKSENYAAVCRASELPFHFAVGRAVGSVATIAAAYGLVAAAGAYWAAMQGGNHRDKGTAFPDVFRRY